MRKEIGTPHGKVVAKVKMGQDSKTVLNCGLGRFHEEEGMKVAPSVGTWKRNTKT